MSLKISLLLVFLSLVSRPAAAWGPTGHKTVALIAQARLSPEVRQKIRQILGVDGALPQIASCPDFIRGSNGTNCGHLFHIAGNPASGGWHYIDMPVSDSPSADTLEKYCASGGQTDDCVVDRVRDQIKVLKDSGATRYQKQVALMFLVHFVGDEHQPLHCSTENLGDGTTDRGGNLKLLTYMGLPDNLHKLWDDILEPPLQPGAPPNKKSIATNPYKLAAILGKKITREQIDAWTSGDVVTEAALESFETSKNVIYPSYHASEDHVFGKDYRRRMQPIAFERIERAGVRLAYLLNEALGTAPPADDTGSDSDPEAAN